MTNSSLSQARDSTSIEPTPVNKWVWPGLLIALPASVIVASVTTAVFMVGRPDGLVASDYYKQGKAINAQLVKIERARELGLAAIEFDASDRRVRMRFLDARARPGTVEFVFAHPIDESKDIRQIIAPSADDVYELAIATPLQERRRVYASDYPVRSWRSEAIFVPK
jgi:uncharacterized protein